MADMVTYPLNNIDYEAADAELFHVTRNSGVYASNDFEVTITGADNMVTIGPGIAWIKDSKFSGKVAANKNNKTIDMGLADANFPRWDIICIQFDKNKNETNIVKKTGVASTTPQMPEISQTETLYELYLRKIYRPAGAVAITQADIYDLRLDPAVCGLMADSVTNVDTSAISAQVVALIENLRAEIDAVKDESALMLKSVYDTDGDGTVDNAKKLDGHEADYFSTFRDCSNVPFNEIASGKGAFLVNWDSANSPNANKLFGISDGWTAIAMSYTGEIYITTIEKTSWEAMSLSKSGGTFTSDAVHFNNYRANVGSYYGSNTDHNAHLATIGEDGLISQICVYNDMKVFAQQWKDGQYIKGATIMTDAGGDFTGNVKARTDTVTIGSYLRNITVKSKGTDVSTMSIYFTRE